MELRADPLFAPSTLPPSGFSRLPTVTRRALVATSHPLATRAGVRALEEGGNAVDAALTAAAVLTVAEPPLTGIGGDAFAQLWWDGELLGLNGSGRSPAQLDGGGVDHFGPRSVTVPGAVAAWSDLAARFGRLGLDRCLAPVIDLAETGRLPVDNPSTHLELTMIHEAMILEYSGRYLALIEWASAIKLALFLTLLANIFFPWGIAVTAEPAALGIGAAVFVVKIGILGLGLAFLETSVAKLRLFRVPELLSASFMLALLAVISFFFLR